MTTLLRNPFLSVMIASTQDESAFHQMSCSLVQLSNTALVNSFRIHMPMPQTFLYQDTILLMVGSLWIHFLHTVLP